mmetsp:Transcript_16832/g.52267  ORF Transcript_16832/g.52267 Transcript_16832/m.52267 type:complete len:105 (+) Transcript_16832:919-1233(+)
MPFPVMMMTMPRFTPLVSPSLASVRAMARVSTELQTPHACGRDLPLVVAPTKVMLAPSPSPAAFPAPLKILMPFMLIQSSCRRVFRSHRWVADACIMGTAPKHL